MKTEEQALMVSSGFEAVATTLMPYAQTLKAELITKADEIVLVWDEETQSQAVGAMKEIKDVLGSMETLRKELKKPALDFGKKVDEIAKNYVLELQQRYDRLSGCVGQYQEVLEKQKLEKQKEEWAKQQKIQAELDKKLASAKNEAEANKALEIAAKKLEMSKATEALAVPEKVQGLSLVKTPCYEITDLNAAFKARPDLFKYEPSASKINEAIKGGMEKCEGLRIWWENSTRLRK